jgi:hypothetical protein
VAAPLQFSKPLQTLLRSQLERLPERWLYLPLHDGEKIGRYTAERNLSDEQPRMRCSGV